MIPCLLKYSDMTGEKWPIKKASVSNINAKSKNITFSVYLRWYIRYAIVTAQHRLTPRVENIKTEEESLRCEPEMFKTPSVISKHQIYFFMFFFLDIY